MLTECREWQDILYDLGLFGQSWMQVNSVAEAYLTWTIAGVASKPCGAQDVGPITDEKVQELLSKPPASLPPLHVRLVVDILHHLVRPNEFPMPRLPKVN